MAQFYEEIVVDSTYATHGPYHFGFTPRGFRIVLRADGPIQWSFDGTTDHGELGPSGTRPMEHKVEKGTCKSAIWLKGTSNEVVQVWAWS